MIVFTKQAGELWKNNSTGNFSLWFNKYVPVTDDPSDNKNLMEASDYSGNHKNAISFYVDQYAKNKTASSKLLEIKLEQQKAFVNSVKDIYFVLEYSIKLKTPLVMGMGESHPSENGLTLDHNLGIPYIPASSIKGALRHAYTLNLINKLEEEGKLQDYLKKNKTGVYLDEIKTDIPALFGGKVYNNKDEKIETSGSIIVLDAYPVDIPVLKVDILNNHYKEYYNSKLEKLKPPSDTEEPKPVNFMSVETGIEYIFYFLLKKYELENIFSEDIIEKINNAIKRMFKDGLGAKTSIGYGRFDWDEYKTKILLLEEQRKKEELRKKQELEKLEEEKKIEQEKLQREEENKKKKIQLEEEAQRKKLEKDKEKKERIDNERKEALKKGIEGYINVKYFKALEGIKYIVEDHPLTPTEESIIRKEVYRLYNEDKSDRQKNKKWKKKNDGNWKLLGQWIDGEIKNRWFKELTGR